MRIPLWKSLQSWFIPHQWTLAPAQRFFFPARRRGIPQESADDDYSALEKNAAWKYVGYPGFSDMMAKSEDYLVIRRFGSLNVRVLLKSQYEIEQLEEQLKQMDDHTKATADGGCGSFRLDRGTPREAVLEEIDARLKEHNQKLNVYLNLRDRPSASAEQVGKLEEWLSDHPNAIEGAEQAFLWRETDLLTFKPASTLHPQAQRFWLGGCVGTCLHGKEAAIERALLVIMPLLALLLPLLALSTVSTVPLRLLVIAIFTLAVHVFLLALTRYDMARVFAIDAGYFSVLILILIGTMLLRSEPSPVSTGTPTMSPPTTPAIPQATSSRPRAEAILITLQPTTSALTITDALASPTSSQTAPTPVTERPYSTFLATISESTWFTTEMPIQDTAQRLSIPTNEAVAMSKSIDTVGDFVASIMSLEKDDGFAGTN